MTQKHPLFMDDTVRCVICDQPMTPDFICQHCPDGGRIDWGNICPKFVHVTSSGATVSNYSEQARLLPKPLIPLLAVISRFAHAAGIETTASLDYLGITNGDKTTVDIQTKDTWLPNTTVKKETISFGKEKDGVINATLYLNSVPQTLIRVEGNIQYHPEIPLDQRYQFSCHNPHTFEFFGNVIGSPPIIRGFDAVLDWWPIINWALDILEPANWFFNMREVLFEESKEKLPRKRKRIGLKV